MLVSVVQHNDLVFVYCKMLTTMSLVYIHHHSSYNSFLMMRPFKIYSLSNFQKHTRLLLTIVSILYITSWWLIYFITGSLYLLTPFTHFTTPYPLTTTSMFSAFEFGVLFCFVLDFTYKWDHMVFVFLCLTFYT